MTVQQDTTGHGVNPPPPSDNAQWLRRDDRAARLGERLRHTVAAPPHDAGTRTHSRSLGLMPTRALLLDLDDPAQRQFGDYALTALLGQGGMGVVYRAHQTRLERDVALKLLVAGPWAPPDYVERLRHEARHAARLAHPNIVSVFDVDEHDGIVFYTMRLIEGASLRERLAHTCPMPAADAVRLMRRMAEALDYAHRMGVLHLDIKPSNILLDEQDEPHLADFGLARHALPDPADDTHEASGTPYYMAPEQARPGFHALSAATDIHGLGATFFEMLAGRVPIAGATPRETLRRIVEEAPPRLRTVQPAADRDLDAICAKCLTRDPRQRYASAAALADDLHRWQTHRPVHARNGGLAYHAGRFLGRNRTAVALTALVALSLVGGAAGVIWQQSQARREAERAIAMKDYAMDVLRQAAARADAGLPADDLLGNGAQRLESLPAGDPARFELLGVLLQRYDDLGMHHAGRELAIRELGDTPSWRDATDPIRLHVLLGWARMHTATGAGARALTVLTPAVTAFPQPDAPVHIEAMRLLGELHADAGNHDEAERWLRHALAPLERLRPRDDPELAHSRALLAAALAAQRRDTEARALAEQAATDIAPEDSRLRAQVLHQAGLHRMLAGDAPGAEDLFEETRRLRRVLDDTQHAGTYGAIHAANALTLGDPGHAATLLDEAAGVLGNAGRRHGVELAELGRMRGELALAGGDANRAAATFGEALDLYLASTPEPGPDAAYNGALLAIALLRAQRLPEARTAMTRTTPRADADVPAVVNAMRLAASALLARQRGETAMAHRHFDHALALLDPSGATPAPLAFRLRETGDLERIRVWREELGDASAEIRHDP